MKDDFFVVVGCFSSHHPKSLFSGRGGVEAGEMGTIEFETVSNESRKKKGTFWLNNLV